MSRGYARSYDAKRRTTFTSSRESNGFARYASALQRSASCRGSGAPVRSTSGTWRSDMRSSRANDGPSTPGICTSRMSTAGGSCCMYQSASAPSRASTTRKPFSCRTSRSARRVASSSSTTRTGRGSGWRIEFCDPDYYPIARADEDQLAKARIGDIQKDAETYAAITARVGTDVLTVYREWKALNALRLTPLSTTAPASWSFAYRSTG